MISRRDFVYRSLQSCAVAAVPASLSSQNTPMRVSFHLERFAEHSVVHSVLLQGRGTLPIDSKPLPQASKLLAHPTLPLLVALLEVESWEHRPRAAVGLLGYCAQTGRFLETQIFPLSLGATGIVDAAFLRTDDENEERLLVATSSGIRNVFQFGAEGMPAMLIHVHKTISSQDSSAPGLSQELNLDLAHDGEEHLYELTRGNQDAVVS
jgi:hypothetical protein